MAETRSWKIWVLQKVSGGMIVFISKPLENIVTAIRSVWKLRIARDVANPPCSQCAAGNGPLNLCIVVPSDSSLNGLCMNCHYVTQQIADKCSFYGRDISYWPELLLTNERSS